MGNKQSIKPIESGLNDCQLIWFDPEVRGEENNSWYEELQSYSKHNIIYSEQAEEVRKSVEDPEISKNIIIISCGGKYTEIKRRVEESKKVRMIIIYCYNVKNHLHFQEEHIKVWLVTNDFREVIRALQEGWNLYIKHHKFEEVFTEKTFYTMKDYDFLIKNVSLMTSAHEGISIFYPLGYEAIFKQRYQVLVNELKILHKEVVPIIKQEDAKEGSDMEKRIIELLAGLNPLTILKKYTEEGIYKTFNRFIRSGNPAKMKYVKEFALHLRGNMCLLGSPVTKTNIRVYRGLYLPIHFANFWADNKGKVVLLSQYTSTSAAEGTAKKFIEKEPIEGTRKVLMEIDLVSDQNIFLDLMKRFTEEKEIYNGIYFPVDIKKYSKYEDEEEVLFPPLYPIIIQKITQSTDADKMLTVQCIAPNVLSFGQPRDFLCYLTGGMLGDEGIIREEIITKMISFLNMNILTTLDLSMGGVQNINQGQFNELVKAIVPSKSLLNANFTKNGLGSDHVHNICEILKNNQSIKMIDLGSNKFSVKDAEMIAQGLKTRRESLLLFNISHNPIESRGVQIISEGLKTHNLIQELNFNGCDLRSKETTNILGEALKGFKELRTLRVYKTYLSGEGAIDFVEAISQHPNLQELILGKNPIGGEGMIIICEILLKHLPKLTLLYLGNTGCNSEVALPLSQLFLHSHDMEELRINDNKIGSEGCVRIVQSLREHKKLTVLDLENTGIEGKGMRIILDELSKHNEALNQLSLAHNYIGGEAAENVALAIAQLKHLEWIGLSRTKLEAKHIELIMKSILKLNNLRILSLSGNKIGNKSKLIGELLLANRSPLRILGLGMCEIEDDGAAIILEGLKLNTTLKALYLGGNRISKELKSEFDVLAPEREMIIKIDEFKGEEKEKKSTCT